MPTNNRTHISSTNRAQTKRRASGWSLDIKPQENRVALNLSVPVSLKADIEVLTEHFGQAVNEIGVQLLRHALQTNSDLSRLKAASPAPGKTLAPDTETSAVLSPSAPTTTKP